MGHDHSHHDHHHAQPLKSDPGFAFKVGIALNLAFVLLEVIAGLYLHSLSLLSDAGHNLADVAALFLSLLALGLMKVSPNDRYTYGYKKTSILVALFNAAVLLLSIGAIFYESIHRLLHPEVVQGDMIAWIAGIGIIINFFSAMLFMKMKDADLNVKSAYLHLLTDALVSLAIVIGGIVLYFTKFVWIDPLLGILVALLIIKNTWSLLKDSLRLSLDGVPSALKLQDIKERILKVPGIKGVHHIHIWAISTSDNAITAHLVFEQGFTQSQIAASKAEVKHILQHEGIGHATLETEVEDAACQHEDCK
jgi:cobalt-zinc-cadmium efflux system protein